MGYCHFFYEGYCQFGSLHFVIVDLVVVIFNFKSVFLNGLMVKINLLQIVNNINLIDNNIYIYIYMCVYRERERERERVNVQETAWKDSHSTNVSYQPIKE